ncbi:hypothetical protein BJV77DRAFT_964412 [Russula vinacea]|nr:hypothetical protein BJV77DRAFT_964412 [Russula vinacea]
MKSALALAVIIVPSPLSSLPYQTVSCTEDVMMRPPAAATATPRAATGYKNPRATHPSPCGQNFTAGYTAAVNELAFGSNHSFGDACGRCFRIKPTKDPYSPHFNGPFGHDIVVKVNNLCLPHGNASQPNCASLPFPRTWTRGVMLKFTKTNRASAAFFPPPRLAMLGKYQEVSCGEWNGSQGNPSGMARVWRQRTLLSGLRPHAATKNTAKWDEFLDWKFSTHIGKDELLKCTRNLLYCLSYFASETLYDEY